VAVKEDRLKEKIYSVQNYLERKLSDSIDLNRLAFQANYSQFHFTRFFLEETGEAPINYLRRLRLEKAAFDLKTTEKTIIQIALDSGYEAHESFSRAFKKFFNLSPKDYRNNYHYAKSREIIEPKHILTDQIKNVNVESFKIKFERFTGSYSECAGPYKDSYHWNEFIKNKNVSPDSIFCGICHDDPEITDVTNVRFDLGTITNAESIGFDIKEIEGGKFLLATHLGDYKNLQESYEYMLYSFPQISGVKLRNSPLIEIYLNPFPAKLEEARTDILIPIE